MDLFNGRKESTGQVFELFSYFPGKGFVVSLARRDGKNYERVESGLGTAFSPSHATHSEPVTLGSLNAFSYMLGQKESLVLSSQGSKASKSAAEHRGEQEKAKAEGGGGEREATWMKAC